MEELKEGTKQGSYKKEHSSIAQMLKSVKIPQLKQNPNKDEMFYHTVKASMMGYLVPAFIGILYAIEIF